MSFNTLRPRQNGRHFLDDTFKCIFLNENIYISINISLKFVPKVPINNIPTLVPIMAWRRPGNKPLPESMMVRLPTHIWVSQPQWVKYLLLPWGFWPSMLQTAWRGVAVHIQVPLLWICGTWIRSYCKCPSIKWYGPSGWVYIHIGSLQSIL